MQGESAARLDCQHLPGSRRYIKTVPDKFNWIVCFIDVGVVVGRDSRIGTYASLGHALVGSWSTPIREPDWSRGLQLRHDEERLSQYPAKRVLQRPKMTELGR
jgi:hypothetical protein